MFRFLYDLLLALAVLLSLPIVLWRMATSGKYRRSWRARLGGQNYPDLRGAGPVVLIHAVSVGEMQVAGTLALELKKQRPDCRVAVMGCTETGQEVASKLKGVDAHFYMPLDFSWMQRRLLKELRPDLVIVVETDLWYNLLSFCAARRIPCVLANGKLSEKSLRGYSRLPWLVRPMLAAFGRMHVQSPIYAERWRAAGVLAERLEVSGNIKLDSVVPQLGEQRQDFAASLGLDAGRPLLVFGSTHAGEEELALSVWRELRLEFPRLQAAIVPRHPERFEGVAQMLERAGADFNRASRLGETPVGKDLLLVDRMGVLMKLYDLGSIGIVCGSFTPHVGGHNILEPGFYGKPCVYGPWIYKQPGFHQQCQQAQAALQCSRSALIPALAELLRDPQKAADLGARAQELIRQASGAAEKVARDAFSLL